MPRNWAALTALQEVALLLGGRRPPGVAETEYVVARADALARLADVMAGRPALSDAQVMIEARNELDAITGTSSLAQIDDVVNLRSQE